MGKQPLNIDAILATVSRPGDRSPLFCWLYEHHDELAEALQRQANILWRAFVRIVHRGRPQGREWEYAD